MKYHHPSICNPICLALMWPDNSFKEIYKWEIGASNYLHVSRIYLVLQDDFPTLLPSQVFSPTQSSLQVKGNSLHNLSIPQYACQ